MSDYWAVAAQVCTPAELEALRLRDERGFSVPRIAIVLNRSKSSVRERLENADRKIMYAQSEKESA